MVPIYLCDDDPQIRAAIRRELEKEILIKGYDMKVAEACAGPEELLEEIQKSGRRGIYFLDVDLKHGAGHQEDGSQRLSDLCDGFWRAGL